MSKKIVTAEEMRNIDSITIKERGIPGRDLMERAGQAVAEEIMESEPSMVGIVTGKGNNAGDGLVVARLLAEKGIGVKVIMLTEGSNMSDDGRANFEALPESVEIIDRTKLPQIGEIFKDCDFLVDAILGTGIQGAPKGNLGEAIAAMNHTGIPIVAIDIPSGLNADTGIPAGACIMAEMTVTIGLPKKGLLLGDGAKYCGEIITADIGFPEDLTNSSDISLNLIEMEDAYHALPPRPIDGHKGSFGSLLVIAGKRGMSGAAYLTTATALRSGCGMVYGAFPGDVERVLSQKLVECVKIPLRDHQLTHECWDTLEPFFEKADAIALGPGIGTDADTARLVDEIACLDIPMVIDADGLNCLAEKVHYLTNRTAPTIITPHPGEMSRIIDKPISEIMENRVEVARELAQGSKITVILKGFRTIVALEDGQVYVNPTGNNGMAKGGSGDVLTGLIGGLLAQGCAEKDAACGGVFLHGLAGDISANELGQRGMTAQDILKNLPKVLQYCENSCLG
ncbi:MAG: NAD(P)H-hydrate dehydratase [Candidatus Sumerlaeia bacterium]